MSQSMPGPPFGDTPTGPSVRRMSLVAERAVEESETPTARFPPIPPSDPAALANEAILRELAYRRSWKAGVIGALNLASAILAARLILLLAVLGAVGLDWIALAEPDPVRLAAIGIYGGMVVLPVVWVASRR